MPTQEQLQKDAEKAAVECFLAAQRAAEAAELAGGKIDFPMLFKKAEIEAKPKPVETSKEEVTQKTNITQVARKPVFCVTEGKRQENLGFCLVQLPSPIPNDEGNTLRNQYAAVLKARQATYLPEIYGWKLEIPKLPGVRKELAELGFLEVKPQRSAENPVEEHAVKVFCALAQAQCGFEEADEGLGRSLMAKAVNGFKMTDGQFKALVALSRKYGHLVEAEVGKEPERTPTEATIASRPSAISPATVALGLAAAGAIIAMLA